MALKLGYKKTNLFSHGQPIYKKGKSYISRDIDGHSSGIWKKASFNYKNLFSKHTRDGTYNEDLTIKIGP